ncbi:MAG: hypothetical protein JNL96_28855 [Planctomycetaceae bacterium]|nr:hypothetical protein [Planctomycetaceae bacterium]
MGSHSTVTVTTGRAGAGKSFVRCAIQFVDELLPETGRKIWTNFPLGRVPDHHCYPPAYEGETFRERIAEAVAAKTGGTVTEYLERINLIDREEIERWRKGESGPWDFFKDKDISETHIAIDEIHVFCGAEHKPVVKAAWKNWLGEIRHRGATVELISQHRDKIAKELVKEASVHISLVKIDDTRDPVCGIKLADWYELRAKFLTGEYTSTVAEFEKMDVDGRLTQTNYRQFKLTGDYFRFYDSFSAPESGSGSGAKLPEHQFQRRGRVSLLCWFLLKNSGQLGWRMGLVAFLLWLTLFGGAGVAARKFGDVVQGIAATQKAKLTAKSEADRPPAAGPSSGPSVKAMPRAGSPEAAERAELDRLAAQVSELEKREAVASEIVLVAENEIVTRGGETYGVGSVIELGKHKGAKVVSIDYRRRNARLSNGEVLRMGGGLGGGVDGMPNLPGSERTPHMERPALARYPVGNLRPNVGRTDEAGEPKK